MPTVPDHLLTNDWRLMTAIRDAMATTENESILCATNCVRLRGSDGQIAATDRRQALAQSGFNFPWKNDVLVPASEAFESPGFSQATDVAIGRCDDSVTVQADAWRLYLKIEKERCFPNFDLLIPRMNPAATRLVLSDDDVEVLLKSISQLPGAADDHAPVTMDLNGMVAIRAESMDQSSIAELVLRNSRCFGNPLQFHTNRKFLSRAIQLGFREIWLQSNIASAICQVNHRTYLWALLSEECPLPPDRGFTRISSPLNA